MTRPRLWLTQTVFTSGVSMYQILRLQLNTSPFPAVSAWAQSQNDPSEILIIEGTAAESDNALQAKHIIRVRYMVTVAKSVKYLLLL